MLCCTRNCQSRAWLRSTFIWRHRGRSLTTPCRCVWRFHTLHCKHNAAAQQHCRIGERTHGNTLAHRNGSSRRTRTRSVVTSQYIECGCNTNAKLFLRQVLLIFATVRVSQGSCWWYGSALCVFMCLCVCACMSECCYRPIEEIIDVFYCIPYRWKWLQLTGLKKSRSTLFIATTRLTTLSDLGFILWSESHISTNST